MFWMGPLSLDKNGFGPIFRLAGWLPNAGAGHACPMRRSLWHPGWLSPCLDQQAGVRLCPGQPGGRVPIVCYIRRSADDEAIKSSVKCTKAV
jgi:hypothetical protein